MNDSQRAPKSNRAFLAFFALYAAGSVFLLLLGLGSALATYLPRVLDALQTWGQTIDVFGLFARGIAQGSRLSASPAQIVIDYVLSLINLSVGIFIVLRRPWDWVARLLGIGMVGTAMAFNFQAHSVVAIASSTIVPLRPIFVYHFILHAVSGATYVHALLLFPNGKLVPHKSLGLMIVIYLLMIEEIAFPVLKYIFGTSLFLAPVPRASIVNPLQAILLYWFSVNGGGLLMSIFHIFFGVQSPISNFGSIIQAETAFFVLLYGLLIPAIGVTSQVYRYRFVSTAEEKQRTKLVVWALACSFTIGLLFFFLEILADIQNAAVFDLTTLERLEESSSWIFPPVFAVIPISLAIAIRRSRLFDIDFVINRTLVYFPLTAILAGVFAALTNILQRLFLALTGETSDAAVIISALIAAAAFTPIRAYLQRLVDVRFHPRTSFAPPTPSIDQSQIQAQVRSLMERAVQSFDAKGGALFWGTNTETDPLHTCGEWEGSSHLTVTLAEQGVCVGKICLAERRNGIAYTRFDQETLEHAANLVASAIRLAQIQ
ncbi:MAG: hypothetical protein HZB51_24960 [Chloroflexi bacterium]|nr:hypothetical protein [Chloroflexota bacterium]